MSSLAVRAPLPVLSQNELTTRCNAVDLTRIANRLTQPIEKSGNGWDAEHAMLGLRQFRHFLTLCGLYPHLDLVPSKTIDAAWHHAILDTLFYPKLCDGVLGRFLHHVPDYDSGNDPTHNRRYQVTRELYLQHFGEELTEVAALCGRCYCDPD